MNIFQKKVFPHPTAPHNSLKKILRTAPHPTSLFFFRTRTAPHHTLDFLKKPMVFIFLDSPWPKIYEQFAKPNLLCELGLQAPV